MLTEYNGHVNNRNNPHDVTAEQAEAWRRKNILSTNGKRVIALGKMIDTYAPNATTLIGQVESFSGVINFIRTNGNNANLPLNVSVSDVHIAIQTAWNQTPQKYSYSILVNGNLSGFSPCSFTYNGQKYFGVVETTLASSNNIGIRGMKTILNQADPRVSREDKKLETIFAVTYHDATTGNIINNEIYNSLKIMGDDSVEMTNGYFSGRASSADEAKLLNGQKISFTGAITGSGTFNGGETLSISTTSTQSTIPSAGGIGSVVFGVLGGIDSAVTFGQEVQLGSSTPLFAAGIYSSTTNIVIQGQAIRSGRWRCLGHGGSQNAAFATLWQRVA